MVRMRCRIVEDDEPGAGLQKLRTALEEHILDREERRFIEPRLAQLLGFGDQESRERQDLFSAWRLFFERLAETYPTVLAFEDMQWADASLLDFVEHLLEWSRGHPLFVLTLARPELAERRATWGAGHRHFTSLYLEPLSEQAMQEMLAGLVPGLPVSLRDQILTRAEGVPLYAVETVRMLLDRGLLVADGSVYRVAGAVESLEVPETLHALIAARLDGLSPEERRLLGDAAVLGKTFTPDALSALSGIERPRLDELLTGLVRREVLGLQSDPRSPEQGQYGFLQDLLRHVSYETLPRRDRRSKHLAAADHLGRCSRTRRSPRWSRRISSTPTGLTPKATAPTRSGHGHARRSCGPASEPRRSAPRPRDSGTSSRPASSRASRSSRRVRSAVPARWRSRREPPSVRGRCSSRRSRSTRASETPMRRPASRACWDATSRGSAAWTRRSRGWSVPTP